MIELMRSPEIHGVVTKEFSRLMRPENFDDYQLLQHFAETKTILYLPEGPIDLGSKMGRPWAASGLFLPGFNAKKFANGYGGRRKPSEDRERILRAR